MPYSYEQYAAFHRNIAVKIGKLDYIIDSMIPTATPNPSFKQRFLYTKIQNDLRLATHHLFEFVRSCVETVTGDKWSSLRNLFEEGTAEGKTIAQSDQLNHTGFEKVGNEIIGDINMTVSKYMETDSDMAKLHLDRAVILLDEVSVTFDLLYRTTI